MDALEVITLVGVIGAAAAAGLAVVFRLLRDRHTDLKREWAVLQSLADELRMNWEMIRLGSARPLHDAWLSNVRDRNWIQVGADNYYDLLSLYTSLVRLSETAKHGSIGQAKTTFQELEPWVAAWWAHLQFEAERWHDQVKDWRSLRGIISRRPTKSDGPNDWAGTFRPSGTQSVSLSRSPSEVKEVVKGQLTDGRPWVQSIHHKL